MRIEIERFLIRHATLFIVIAGLVIVSGVLPLLHQPYVADEVQEVGAAIGIVETGRPYFSDGELRPGQFAYWHPPVYFYLQAAFHYLLGRATTSFRLFGLVLILPTLAITRGLARAGNGTAPWPETGALTAIALLALLPLTPTNFALVEIDPALLALGILAFLWLAIRLEESEPSTDRLALDLGAALSALLWLKATTPLLFLGVLPVHIWFKRGSRAACRFAIAFAVMGLTLFLTGWTLFSYGFLERPPTEMIHHVYSLLLAHGDVGAGMVSPQTRLVLFLSKPMDQTYLFGFISYGLVFLVIADFFLRLLEWRGGSRWSTLDLLRTTLWSGLLMYSFIRVGAYGYPKYVAPLVPLMAILAAGRLVDAAETLFDQRIPGRAFLLGVWLAGTAGWLLWVGGDPMFPRPYGFVIRALLPLTSGWLLLHSLSPRREIALAHFSLTCGGLILAGYLATIPIWTGADYARMYCYGMHGFTEALTRVRAETREGQTIISSREIGFASGRRYVVTEELPGTWDSEATQAILRSPSVPLAVGQPCTARIRDSDPFGQRLRPFFPAAERIGSFVIRRRGG